MLFSISSLLDCKDTKDSPPSKPPTSLQFNSSERPKSGESVADNSPTHAFQPPTPEFPPPSPGTALHNIQQKIQPMVCYVCHLLHTKLNKYMNTAVCIFMTFLLISFKKFKKRKNA